MLEKKIYYLYHDTHKINESKQISDEFENLPQLKLPNMWYKLNMRNKYAADK